MDIKLKRVQRDFNTERDMRVEMENCKSKLDTKLQIAEVDSNVVSCLLSVLTGTHASPRKK